MIQLDASLPSNPTDQPTNEQILPCPFCRRDLSQCSDFAETVLKKDSAVKKEKNIIYIEINKLKQKIAQLQNENVELKETVAKETLFCSSKQIR